jgi:hypothetical protein
MDQIVTRSQTSSGRSGPLKDAASKFRDGDLQSGLQGTADVLSRLQNIGLDPKWADGFSGAASALGGMSQAAQGLKDHDMAGTFAGVQSALQGIVPLADKFGIDISGWEGPLGEIQTGVESFAALQSGIEGVTAVAPALDQHLGDQAVEQLAQRDVGVVALHDGLRLGDDRGPAQPVWDVSTSCGHSSSSSLLADSTIPASTACAGDLDNRRSSTAETRCYL